MKIFWIAPNEILPEWVISSISHFFPHYDKYVYWYNSPNKHPNLVQLVNEVNPDVVMYISGSGGPHIPSASTLAYINRDNPVVCLCFDASHPSYWGLFEEYKKLNSLTTIVNMDGNFDWPSGENDITLCEPVDPTYYKGFQALADRPIHLGTCMGFPDGYRRKVVTYLRGHAGLMIKPREENFGSYAVYAKFLCECQMVLNVAFNSTADRTVIKARVLETGLAGACLLEQQGSYTSHWFEEGVDYIPYESPEHAAEISKTITLERMEECATNLRAKVLENHHPKIFWSKVFERIPSIQLD